MSPTERIILTCRAWHRAARLLQTRCQRLRSEVARLDALWGETISQRDHWQWEAQRRIYARQELADLLGTEDIEEAVGAVRRLRTWAARWKAVAHRHRSHVRGLTMRWARNLTGRVRAELEVTRLRWVHDLTGRVRADREVDRLRAALSRLADLRNILGVLQRRWPDTYHDGGEIRRLEEAVAQRLREVVRESEETR